MIKSTISDRFKQIMEVNKGKNLHITIFPHDMWLSQAELEMFTREQCRQNGSSVVEYKTCTQWQWNRLMQIEGYL